MVYASNDGTIRERLWHSIEDMSQNLTTWILMGDFNVVRTVEVRVYVAR